MEEEVLSSRSRRASGVASPARANTTATTTTTTTTTTRLTSRKGAESQQQQQQEGKKKTIDCQQAVNSAGLQQLRRDTEGDRVKDEPASQPKGTRDEGLAGELRATKLEGTSQVRGAEREASTRTGAARNQPPAQQSAHRTKGGLLEALLEGRKSWLEHKTVIVDIKNERRRTDSLGNSHENNLSASSRLSPAANNLDSNQHPTNSVPELPEKEARAKPDSTLASSALRRNTLNESKKIEDNEGEQLAPQNDRETAAAEARGAEGATVKAAASREQDQRVSASSRRQTRVSQAGGGSGGSRTTTPNSQGDKQRIPTFGGVPQKLSRLPYFSYYGKARNVDLVSSADRATAVVTDKYTRRQTTASSASSSSSHQSLSSALTSSSSSSGVASSAGSSGNIPTLTKSNKDHHQQQHIHSPTITGPRQPSKQSGYSNISNLFPDRPMSVHRRASSSAPPRRPATALRYSGSGERSTLEAEHRADRQQRQQQQQRSSASLVNLTSETAAVTTFGSRSAQSGRHSTATERHQPKDEDRIASSATLNRRNSFSQQPQQVYSSRAHRYGSSDRNANRSLHSLNASPNSPAAREQTMSMRRQNSAGYGSVAHNRPLHYQRGLGHQQAAGRPMSATGTGYLSGYGRQPYRSPSAASLHGGSTGLSPYGPPLLDPDCPVHGYNSPGGGLLGGHNGQTLSKSASQYLDRPAETDPLYEPYPLLYEPHPNFYERPAAKTFGGGGSIRGRPHAVYSPSSPTAATIGAYYDELSRFSVYHSPSAAGGADGGRSSLAPAQEQVRRILGYQPHVRPVHLHPQWAYSRPFIHLQGVRSPSPVEGGAVDQIRPKFAPYNRLQDSQAIRAVDFHPSGEVYAVGSNSRALRICAYPADHELRHFAGPTAGHHQPLSPRILFKFLQVHRGSIYCVRFNTTGQLLATGSNDQTVHIVRYNPFTHSPDGDEYRLTMHDGTVRDLCFIDDPTNGSALLLSAGGGDNKIYVTDCDTITPFQSMAGHSQMVMALHHWSGATFVSGSFDRTIRLWDLRTRTCTSIISAPPADSTPGNKLASSSWSASAGPGAPVCAVKVDPSGRLLVSGHTDSTCMLYDIRGARVIQTFKPHDDEIRTVSFSPKSYYLLTGGYDGRIVLTDLQGDLTQPLPSACVAEIDDKVVQSSWHPSDFTFVTTSADKTATLWAIPTEQ